MINANVSTKTNFGQTRLARSFGQVNNLELFDNIGFHWYLFN